MLILDEMLSRTIPWLNFIHPLWHTENTCPAELVLLSSNLLNNISWLWQGVPFTLPQSILTWLNTDYKLINVNEMRPEHRRAVLQLWMAIVSQSQF